MDDKEYWRKYYSKNFNPTEPSSFARFVLDYLENNKTLIELGCGNGRDSVFFHEHELNVIGVDQVSDEVNYLNKNYGNGNLRFISDDFSNLSNPKEENKLILEEKFDYIILDLHFTQLMRKKKITH